jgi:hypothetical protein
MTPGAWEVKVAAQIGSGESVDEAKESKSFISTCT